MIDYSDVFGQVAAHLKKLKVRSQLTTGRRAAPSAIAAAQKNLGIPFPDQLARMYCDFSDGMQFVWLVGNPETTTTGTHLTIPPLERLVSNTIGRRKMREETRQRLPAILAAMPPERRKHFEAKLNSAEGLKNQERQREMDARSARFVLVLSEANGDHVAIDTSSGSCPVVFDQHDWNDSGTGEYGPLMSRDWEEFMLAWAGVCFQTPDWWKPVLKRSGVDWKNEEFAARYRLAIGAG